MATSSLSHREKRLIQAAILLAIILLVSLLLRGGGGGSPPPPRPDRTALVSAPAPILAAPPAVPTAPAPPPVPAADPSQLRLYGLLASGAVIGDASGGQRLVPVGREVSPGLTLARIEQSHAILQGASGEIWLGFDGIEQAPPPAAAAPPVVGGQREEDLRYRLGLIPRTEGGRVTGYVVQANVEMPALARAGIQPGDVLLAVNGRAFDAQQLQALAGIIAGAADIRFEVERNGRRLQPSLRRH